MLPIRTILHPTDFSEHSRYAFGLAFALARDHGARLVLLHVAVPSEIVCEGAVVPLSDDYQQQLLAELRRLRIPDPDLQVEYRLGAGDAAREILRVARETHAELIIMGTHGRTGLGRLLLGSIAEAVLRRADCPVLTVRAPLPVPLAVDPEIEEGAELFTADRG